MACGRRAEFEEALEIGLIHRVIDGPDFAGQVSEYASQFVPPNGAAKAVGAIKRAVQSGLEMSFTDGLALERELQQQLCQTDNAREGLEAYLAKRRPRFKGR